MTDARTHCPICHYTFRFVVVIDAEIPDRPGQSDDADHEISSCPRCGSEVEVLFLSDELRAALSANREGPA